MSTAAGIRTARPEAFRLAVATWAVALLVELIHQIAQISMSLIDPAELMSAAREEAGSGVEGASDTLITFSVYGSIMIMGLVSLLIIVGLVVALRFYAARHRLADGARRLLMVFSLYFALRGLLVFVAVSAGSAVPVWLTLLDGSLQLIVAVAAILGLVFSGRKESVDYLAEVNQADPEPATRN